MAAAAEEVSFTSARTVRRRDGLGFGDWGRKNLGRMGSRLGWGGKGERKTPLQRRREAMDEVSFVFSSIEWEICFLLFSHTCGCRVSCVMCAYTVD